MFSWLMTGTALLAAALGAPQGATDAWLPREFKTLNIVAPMVVAETKPDLPLVVAPFTEHVRGGVGEMSAENAVGLAVSADGTVSTVPGPLPKDDKGREIVAEAEAGGVRWRATAAGLFLTGAKGKWTRHEEYGVNGPLASQVTALAADRKGNLWVGTPVGLSVRAADGTWSHRTGRDGLPVEQVTALAVDANDDVWIGTTHGAVLYRPEAEGRRWFYRAGPRYLPGDHVKAITPAPDGKSVWFLTDAGVGRLDSVTTTLLERAQTIERIVNERHRRWGMVAACVLDDPENPAAGHSIGDNDNDGLWTAYHVAAMSLCYGATKDEAAKASAREGMHALYMLQNASGIPGLVARSVVPPEIGKTKSEQWRPTADGKMYWKSDTSSDEIDGHYLAFYAYFEHVAQYDAAERKLIEKQVRDLTNYIVDNGYQLIDWHGKRTRWGFWDPKSLNGNPADAVEAGLNSLQILSFLKVAHYITGDKKFQDHYRALITEHRYLDNILLTKKHFPDENNHSDDQLGYVAWYPILQLEKDPKVRRALITGVRRHYEVVRPEQPSFYAFATATVAPYVVDYAGAVENLRQIPTDRREWAMKNSHRADVRFAVHPNRFGKPVITDVLPADERIFVKWNADPYLPDGGGDGRVEDDGAAFLLPYWMGRYHGFIAEQQ